MLGTIICSVSRNSSQTYVIHGLYGVPIPGVHLRLKKNKSILIFLAGYNLALVPFHPGAYLCGYVCLCLGGCRGSKEASELLEPEWQVFVSIFTDTSGTVPCCSGRASTLSHSAVSSALQAFYFKNQFKNCFFFLFLQVLTQAILKQMLKCLPVVFSSGLLYKVGVLAPDV